MASERKKKKLEIEIYADRELKLQSYILFLLKHSNDGEKVHPKIIHEIVEICTEVWGDKDAYTFELINQVYDRFKKYDFKSRRKIKYDLFIEDGVIQEERFVTMSLKGLIEQIVILTAHKNYSSKKECVHDLVTIINNICSDSLNKKKQKDLTTYIRYAIAGFITMKYGFHLFSGILEKQPTNQQLYKKVYDIINK